MNPPNTQAHKVALITGAARRIGACIAQHFHDAGYRVVIHCHHSQKEAEGLVAAMNQKRQDSALMVIADLMQKQDSDHLITQTLSWGVRLDVLVNNASLFINTDLTHDIEDDHWDRLFTTNVKAPFWLSHRAYQALEKTKGTIINLTDIHAEKPLKGYAIYCQTKAALTMQTKALAREFAPKVRVNAVAPGAIAWPEEENALSDALKNNIIEKTPLKQHGDPRFIAQAVMALVDNPFITGQTLVVDGGRELT